MERKRKFSDVSISRIGSYLLVLPFVLAFVTPTLLSASEISTIKEDHVFPMFIKWHIYIVNRLSNNQNLFTHCKSAENDLGDHDLSPGSNTTWSFRTEFFQGTLFWCHVSKDDASATFNVFWNDARLFDKCGWKKCIWVVKDDGVYLTHLSTNCDELRYKWGDRM